MLSDKTNGSVFFNADLDHGGKSIELQRNRWTDALLDYQRCRALPLDKPEHTTQRIAAPVLAYGK